MKKKSKKKIMLQKNKNIRSKSEAKMQSSSTTTLSPSSTAVPTASSSSSSSSSSSISSSSSASQNTSVFKQSPHLNQPLAQTHKKHSSHTLKPISIAHPRSTLSQNASEIKRQKKELTAITYSSSTFSSSSSSSVLQEPFCSPRPTLPSLLHHWVGCVETCVRRSTMEDSVLLLPVDGWDIEKLMCDGEVGILARILKYPQELMFTVKGMKALEDRDDEIWARRMREKEKRKKERMKRKRKEWRRKREEGKKNPASSGQSYEETLDTDEFELVDETESLYTQKPASNETASLSEVPNSSSANRPSPNSQPLSTESKGIIPPIPYFDKKLKGCGVYGVFDGHRGSDTAMYLTLHFVECFLSVSAVKGEKKRRMKRKKRRRG
ncbi:uncharacterized protein MONOS_11467 [Monocercomonoides exilis]|uniref:uncharacterized protein n=1 Tax=Monocercomonoides exilis TaxID=2049356 RepID=UPI0035598FCE|nr:hypothetical protein MONOS_11467 [Monocercomonoides exilis]|eukprot:MONOS_11467.1-p1 / transcript=MONOS_11467.1 / gene=MONOS_11467 / organism=Monocercomonoides_exilis_PA203 / gene_product=unspecified product / transcript_product=unspecified product / location=Mono_scaffold00577:39421-40758(-) / protein_length=380 / sequence_SO=supercontig / SO=protein_coding / is_pseudo=false